MADTFLTPAASALTPRPVRVLAVGATGRLGKLLVSAWRHPAFGVSSGIELVVQARREGKGGDILFDPLVEEGAFRQAAEAADVVLCLAGVTPAVPPAQHAEMGLNVALAQAACEAGKATGRPVILASSAAVYGRGSATGASTEETALEPLSDYGRAKAEMEAMARGYRAICCLRIGNVAGADAVLGTEAPPDGRILDMFGGPEDGPEDGPENGPENGQSNRLPHGPQRSYIGPVTLARAIARLARLMAAGKTLPEVLNMAETDVVSMDALLHAAGEPFTPRPAPPTAIERVELDVGRAVALGLVPECPVQAARLVAEVQDLRGDTQ